MQHLIEISDAELKNDVLSELKFEPNVKVTEIGVLVQDGAVTLNGFATSYGEKLQAVRAAKRVAGVKAIADDIAVKLPDSLRRTDGDIASAAANQIAWSATVPTEAIDVTVRDGWITLQGVVESKFQKEEAENVVHHLSGVKGVSNMISLEPKRTPIEFDTAIKAAFERNALLDAGRITVETSGNEVALSGDVRSYPEKEEAERIAWSAPGVLAVDNQLMVK